MATGGRGVHCRAADALTLTHVPTHALTRGSALRLTHVLTHARLQVDVEYTVGRQIRVKRGVHIGRIPLMLRARQCVLAGATEATLIGCQECPLDPGGYFIVKGTEKVVLIQVCTLVPLPGPGGLLHRQGHREGGAHPGLLSEGHCRGMVSALEHEAIAV